MNFADQPAVFLQLMAGVYRRRSAEQRPHETLDDALAELNDLVFHAAVESFAEHDEDRDHGRDLRNLAELGAVLLEAAHALVLCQMSEAQVREAVEGAAEDAEIAETDRAVEAWRAEKAQAPAAALAPAEGADATDRHFAGLRGAGIGISGSDKVTRCVGDKVITPSPGHPVTPSSEGGPVS